MSWDAFEPVLHEAMRFFERRAQLLAGDLCEPAPG
jgi:hypothetical protein